MPSWSREGARLPSSQSCPGSHWPGRARPSPSSSRARPRNIHGGRGGGGGKADPGGNRSPAFRAAPSGRSLPGPAPSSPPSPGAGRSLSPYTDPPRTRFLRSRTPALASRRDEAALPRAPRAPWVGAQSACPFSESSATTVAPGHSTPSPAPAGVTTTASGKPLRKAGSKQHRRGAQREAAALGTARQSAAPSALPPTALGCPRSYLLSASPGKTAASLSLPAGPRTSRRRRPGVGTGPGPPRQPEPLHRERRRQNSAAPPRAAPPARAAPPTPNRRGDDGDKSRARGAMVAPALAPLPAPSLHPPPRLLPLGLLPPPPGHSSPPPPAARPPARPPRALLPSPRGEGERHRQSPQRLSNQPAIYTRGARRPRLPPARPTCLGFPPESGEDARPDPATCLGLPSAAPGSSPVRGSAARGRRVGAAGPHLHLQRPLTPLSRPGPHAHTLATISGPPRPPALRRISSPGPPPQSPQEMAPHLGGLTDTGDPGLEKLLSQVLAVSTPQPRLSKRWGPPAGGSATQAPPRPRPGPAPAGDARGARPACPAPVGPARSSSTLANAGPCAPADPAPFPEITTRPTARPRGGWCPRLLAAGRRGPARSCGARWVTPSTPPGSCWRQHRAIVAPRSVGDGEVTQVRLLLVRKCGSVLMRE
ncbi:nascent polypeptide-associated complex subunit alpha, muscle-specific form-like [Elephas maximus indicus]|uniref:nascent polypeptide-associated complex subunit alpha, muscle-specific form-like n=1 Tax=Elephas maximus indicus TaxID=99487 RepID=UPI002116EBB6|nr:nascent polypeptide-associated complex subunit alpha, muscle-specific form-like [Elephas maximus indicus]